MLGGLHHPSRRDLGGYVLAARQGGNRDKTAIITCITGQDGHISHSFCWRMATPFAGYENC